MLVPWWVAPSVPVPVTVAVYFVAYFSGEDGTQLEPSRRIRPLTAVPSAVVRTTFDTVPPPGTRALISVLAGRPVAPSAGLTDSGDAAGAASLDGVPVGSGAVDETPPTSCCWPGTKAGFSSPPPHPVSASDAVRTRTPTIAPARANLPMPTPVVACLADIVPHRRQDARPRRGPAVGFGRFCRLSSSEGWTPVSDWNPAQRAC
ncbi:hypothetical protein TPA0908_15640 [Micromonospora sp. AKA38]|nr:hypothetical protein TPA0908_15640 [Micromonospora sp. AKA38]